jgi:hypothetical protein
MSSGILHTKLQVVCSLATRAAQEAAHAAQEIVPRAAWWERSGKPTGMGLPGFGVIPVLIVSSCIIPVSFSSPVPRGTVHLPSLVWWGIGKCQPLAGVGSLYLEGLPLVRYSLTWTWIVYCAFLFMLPGRQEKVLYSCLLMSWSCLW